jgi:hypothetical protein
VEVHAKYQPWKINLIGKKKQKRTYFSFIALHQTDILRSTWIFSFHLNGTKLEVVLPLYYTNQLDKVDRSAKMGVFIIDKRKTKWQSKFQLEKLLNEPHLHEDRKLQLLGSQNGCLFCESMAWEICGNGKVVSSVLYRLAINSRPTDSN